MKIPQKRNLCWHFSCLQICQVSTWSLSRWRIYPSISSATLFFSKISFFLYRFCLLSYVFHLLEISVWDQKKHFFFKKFYFRFKMASGAAHVSKKTPPESHFERWLWGKRNFAHRLSRPWHYINWVAFSCQISGLWVISGWFF